MADQGAVPFLVGEGFDKEAMPTPREGISWSPQAIREGMAA